MWCSYRKWCFSSNHHLDSVYRWLYNGLRHQYTKVILCDVGAKQTNLKGSCQPWQCKQPPRRAPPCWVTTTTHSCGMVASLRYTTTCTTIYCVRRLMHSSCASWSSIAAGATAIAPDNDHDSLSSEIMSSRAICSPLRPCLLGEEKSANDEDFNADGSDHRSNPFGDKEDKGKIKDHPLSSFEKDL